MEFLSFVCPVVFLSKQNVYRQTYIYIYIYHHGMAVILVFILAQKHLQNSKGDAVGGNIKYRGGKNLFSTEISGIYYNKLCGKPPQYATASHVTLTFWPWKSESRVTWAASVPILVFLGLSVLDFGPMYMTVHDRQTSDAHHRLMPPRRWRNKES